MFSLSYVYLLLETNFIVATAVVIKIVKKWLDQQEEKHEMEKRLITKELAAYGIQSIYTAPKNLSVNTINKYLELKSRNLI